MAETLQVAGSIAAAAAAAAAILIRDRRLRAAAMVVALILAAALVTGEAWHDQLRDIRHHPLALSGALLGLVVVVGALALAGSRWPALPPLLLLAALPFRIPIHAGGQSSNLLVPLYVVIAAAVVLECAAAFRNPGKARDRAQGPSRARLALDLTLCAAIVLYALQSTYSSDVSRAVQNLSFFLIPFAVLYAILRDTKWTPTLLRGAFTVVVGEAVVFALLGIVQHEVHHIFWNSKVVESNEFDLYFRVNSLFWDPNIYGRYLALALIAGVTGLVWTEQPRRFAIGALGAAVIFAGLAFSFSQTSFLALLVGLAVLCALRWSLRWTLAGSVVLIAAVAAVVAFSSALTVHSGAGGELEQTTSGRSRLASGGLDLAKNRPLAGYGSGSFAVEFEKRNAVPSGEAAISHTEPITVAAEQGAVGLLAYAALLAASLVVMFSGLRAIAPGLGGKMPRAAAKRTAAVARVAIAAGFLALLFHTMGYAGFLIDPLTWALLAVGAALAVTPTGRTATT